MDGPYLERRGRFLIARFGRRHRLLSFAIVRGGFVDGETVAWCAVRDDELRPPVDPALFLEQQLAGAAIPDAVGLMTSASLDAYVEVEHAAAGIGVQCVATVGLDNALRAGDPVAPAYAPAGTINILCRSSASLSDQALIEMLSLVAEARTLAVLEGGVASRASGLPATGTGTDCIVVAAPSGQPAVRHAGKHTMLGHLVGAAVGDAVGRGVRGWLAWQDSRRAQDGRS